MPDEPTDPPAPELERKVATILSADVAGYSRLMAADEESTLRIFRGHKQVFESLVAMHRGRIFNTAGDAILAEFSSVVEAVRCATEIQTALRTRNDALPDARQVQFRIGVNLGDVMVQGTDLMGDGVNVAARLQTAAEPGGICVSGTVYDQIRNKLSLSFRSLGEQTYKNIPQPVRTFAITEAEGAGVLPTPQTARVRMASAAKWVAAAAVLALIGGGYVAYRQSERQRVEQARVLAQTQAARQAAEEGQRRADAERQAAETAGREAQIAARRTAAEEALKRVAADRQRLEAEKRASDLARQQAEAGKNRAEAEARRASEEAQKNPRQTVTGPAQQAARPSGPPVASKIEGVYSGPLCYGASPNEPARCFRAQVTVFNGQITGEWPGRDPGVTFKASGEVSPTGAVKIDIHGENATGTRTVTINMTGAIQDERLDATGSFRTGRRVYLNWRRN